MGNLEEAIAVIAHLGIPTPLLDRSLVVSLRDRIIDLQTRYANDKNVVLDPFPGERCALGIESTVVPTISESQSRVNFSMG